jgi:hypothetical protein
LGIFLKSRRPSRFCVVLNTAWSVATTCNRNRAQG